MRSPQFVILLIGELECDFAFPTLNQHVEDVAVFERLRTASSATELDLGLIAVAKAEARRDAICYLIRYPLKTQIDTSSKAKARYEYGQA
jgi:hypothetical protein